MSEDASIALTLLSTLIAWSVAWLLVVDYRNRQAKNLIISHLLGCWVGSGAAVGAMCLFGALLMPSNSNSIVIGNIGAAILLMYWVVYLFSTRPLVRVQPKKTDAHAQQEDTLGMPLADFYSARLEEHLACWGAVLFLAVWFWIFTILPLESAWGLAITSTLCMLLLFYLFGITRLRVLPISVLLVFSVASIFLEAKWRVRNNMPYVAPVPPSIDEESAAIIKSISTNYAPPPIPSTVQSCWLFPFVMGLWMGHTWGDDG